MTAPPDHLSIDSPWVGANFSLIKFTRSPTTGTACLTMVSIAPARNCAMFDEPRRVLPGKRGPQRSRVDRASDINRVRQNLPAIQEVAEILQSGDRGSAKSVVRRRCASAPHAMLNQYPLVVDSRASKRRVSYVRVRALAAQQAGQFGACRRCADRPLGRTKAQRAAKPGRMT